ncbi:hypothetical protein, partial [Streptomyces sp. 8L]|uniref:hypothetical protein n=1 Tax=Streptomyces sp. 8L TaxID=2877242 RepID=UPI001CD4CA70
IRASPRSINRQASATRSPVSQASGVVGGGGGGRPGGGGAGPPAGAGAPPAPPGAGGPGADTEELREVMVGARGLFEQLLGARPGGGGRRGRPAGRTGRKETFSVRPKGSGA